jgi:hypothetical protein
MSLSSREDKVCHVLFWAEARNRSTGQIEPLGLWSGDDAQVFDVDGDLRTYHGPAMLPLPPIEGGVGLEIRQLVIPVPHLTPEVETLLRQYDPKLARAEIHFAEFSPDTRDLLSLQRVFKGWINQTPINTAAEGGEGGGELILVSAARALTKTLALYRSDADQKKRNSADRFREYSSTTGLKEVWWGQRRVTGPNG